MLKIFNTFKHLKLLTISIFNWQLLIEMTNYTKP